MGNIDTPTYELMEMGLDETFEVLSDLSWDDIGAKTFELITTLTESDEVYKELESHRSGVRDAIYNSLGEQLGIMGHLEINRISRSGSYIMFDLKDGRKLVYDIFKYSDHPEANNVFRGDYHEQRKETQNRWDVFYDYTLAMDAIFEVQGRRLDEEDVFTSSMISDVINPDIGNELVGKSIEEIQLLAREALVNLNDYLGGVPYDLFTSDFRNAIAISQDRYTRMVMGIGEQYRGGATLFENKTQAEVEHSIGFMLHHQGTVSEVFTYWHSIRNAMQGNRDQDTTVEQKAYPLYIQLLNNAAYIRLQQLGATREEVHKFARNIAGYDVENHWRGENHNDYDTAQMIMGSLLGTPSTNLSENDTSESESVFDRLIRSELVNVTDSELIMPESLSVLISEAEEKCTRFGVSYPKFINDTFLGGRDIETFTPKTYKSLDLGDKFALSSVARFIQKIGFSNGDFPHQYSTDNQDYGDTYFCSTIARAVNNITYNRNTPSIFSIELPHRDSIGNKAILEVPREYIQSVSGARFYIQRFQNILDDENIFYDGDEGVFLTDDNEDIIDSNDLLQKLGVYQEDSNELLNIVEDSISESLDYLTANIEAHFDSWDWDSSEDSSINPDDLRNKYDECGILFSETDIEILKTWMDMRGLGEYPWEWSDQNQGHAVTGLKIAILMAVAIAATYATAGLAGGIGLTTVAGLLRGGTLVQQGTRAVIQGTIRGQIIQGGVMGFYAAPASWYIYPKGYTSDGEMITDLGTDMLISTITGFAGGWMGGKFHSVGSPVRNGFITATDIGVLGLFTEAKRMQAVDSYYHGENLFQEPE